jgi:hypothetical protein
VLQDAGTRCPKGTTAIAWNQQGPAGPPGPATAGPGGLNVTTVTNNNSGVASARCPSNEPYVISGEAVGSSGTLIASFPWDFTTDAPLTGPEISGDVYGWQATAQDIVTLYAVCSA